MAGPLTHRFVEAVEVVLAQEIVQLARNAPEHLVLYTFHENAPSAVPLVMISKFEAGMSDSQFKLRVWDEEVPGRWEYCTPIFPTMNQVVAYISRSLTPDPCRHLGVGSRRFRGPSPTVLPVAVETIQYRSIATEWLAGDEVYHLFCDYIDEIGHEDFDCVELRGDWVEDEEHFEILLENVVFFHVSISFL
jgi:hypothetical protein